jgi:formate hydrogenlyase subunit 5
MPVRAWRDEVANRVAAGERFAGLHATERGDRLLLTALLAVDTAIEPVDAELDTGASGYPALTNAVPAAAWYEREVYDTFGLCPIDHPRLDPLVLPLDEAASVRPRPGSGAELPPLVPDEAVLPSRVLGTGLFTIPHGPVRSGVFESVEYLVETPGEDIPHVGIRVFTKHRGIERRFEDVPLRDAVLLAERVEGIASVAHALAYCHAIEALTGAPVSTFAGLVRVIYAELERIANHLDVAMKLCDAAGLAVGTARFGLHKERVLRLVGAMCGSRFGRGVVTPGGVSGLPSLAPAEIRRRLAAIESQIRLDASPLMCTPSFLDRLRRTGVLDPELARTHGALGPIGRASGFNDDDRRQRPYDGYLRLEAGVPDTQPGCDAMTRMNVRWDEVWDSCALVHRAVELLSEMAVHSVGADSSATDDQIAGRGIGWAEAPQGEVVYTVTVGDGRITRCKPRSASFHNLVLFHDVFGGDILTDFPFIEASFGLSIAGVAG